MARYARISADEESEQTTMSQPRFVETKLPLTVEQIQKYVPEATYAMNVQIYLDEAAQGGHVSLWCTGMMLKVSPGELLPMAGFLGDRYNFTIAGKREKPKEPIRLTIYAKEEIHVKSVSLLH
jgi:hypothetical protein